jgi:WD40 repeat protein
MNRNTTILGASRRSVFASVLAGAFSLAAFLGAARETQAQNYLGSISTSGYGQNSGQPFGLTFAPNGDLYVALAGASAFVNPQNFNNNVVLRIDASTSSVAAVIPVGLFPEDIAFAQPAGGPNVGIVTNSTDGTVTIFDESTDAPITTITLPGGFFTAFPFGVETNAAGTRAYVGANSSVYAIDTDPASATAYQLLPLETIVPASGFTLRFHRYGNDLVCGASAYDISFSGSTAFIERIPLAGSSNPNVYVACASASNFTYPSVQDTAFGASGVAYCGGYDSAGRIFGYDINTGTLVRSFPSGTTGKGLVGLALSPDEKVLVVCDVLSNEVAFLDVARGLPIAIVDTTFLPFGGFQQPNDAVFSPDGLTVYVTVQGSEAVLRFSAPPAPAPYFTGLGLTATPTDPAQGSNVNLVTTGAQPTELVAILYDEADFAIDLGFTGIFHLTPNAVMLASANGTDVNFSAAVPAGPGLYAKNFLLQAIAVDFNALTIRFSDEVPVVLQQ